MVVNVEGSPEKRRFNGDIYMGIEGNNNNYGEMPRIREPRRKQRCAHWLSACANWVTNIEFSEQFMRSFHWTTQVCLKYCDEYGECLKRRLKNNRLTRVTENLSMS
jgi:hypothetical protein